MEKRTQTSVAFAAFLFAALLLLMPGAAFGDEAVPALKGPSINEAGVTTWDCVYFGNYPQSRNENGEFVTEPIKWRVLSVKDNDAYLLSDKNIDAVPYNVMEDVKFYCYWHNCTLRSWLNGLDASANKSHVDYTEDNFINRAFTAEEQDAIIIAEVDNSKPIEWGHMPEDKTPVTTYDKVYLLDYYEVTDPRLGFSDQDEEAVNRTVVNTAYTASGGTGNSLYMRPENARNSWLLRSPGEYSMYVDFITAEGAYDDILVDGNMITSTDHGVRPVLHLDLQKAGLYSYAGSYAARYDQKITVSSQFVKRVGDVSFSLKAAVNGDGVLAYATDDEAVATVSDGGIVSISGMGTAHITVTAPQTDTYAEASKTVTIVVKEALQPTDPAPIAEPDPAVDPAPSVSPIPSPGTKASVPSASSAKKKTPKITVSKKTASFKYKKLKKKTQSFSMKPKTSSKAKITCKKISGNKKITVTKAGKVTLKKGLKKATYKVKVKVSSAAKGAYKAASKTFTLKIKVA